MSDLQGELIRALQLDKDGDWDAAHAIVQQLENPNAYWIHAYLHREEGDLGNSQYWYNRAGKSMPNYDLVREWQELAGYMNALDED